MLQTSELEVWNTMNLCQQLDYQMSNVKAATKGLIPLSPRSMHELPKVISIAFVPYPFFQTEVLLAAGVFIQHLVSVNLRGIKAL